MPKRKSAPKVSKNVSAGLLLYRRIGPALKVFLAHPGGPFWANKDVGAWTIPKGLVEEGEALQTAACREFEEETGIKPSGPFIELGMVKQKAGKVIHAWAFEGDADPAQLVSNVVPVKTAAGWRQFPEIDRCEWFSPEEAQERLNPAQAEFVARLQSILAQSDGGRA